MGTSDVTIYHRRCKISVVPGFILIDDNALSAPVTIAPVGCGVDGQWRGGGPQQRGRTTSQSHGIQLRSRSQVVRSLRQAASPSRTISRQEDRRTRGRHSIWNGVAKIGSARVRLHAMVYERRQSPHQRVYSQDQISHFHLHLERHWVPQVERGGGN